LRRMVEEVDCFVEINVGHETASEVTVHQERELSHLHQLLGEAHCTFCQDFLHTHHSSNLKCASSYSTALTIQPLLIRCNQLLFGEHGVLEDAVLLFQAVHQFLHEIPPLLQAIGLVLNKLILLL